MIQEAYCSYEVSKLLKEKGFNEKCRGGYHCEFDDDDNPIVMFEEWMTQPYNNDFVDEGFLCSAPTQQMAMAWLNEVYNIYIEIYVIKNYDKKICEYTYTIMDLNFPGSDDGIDCCNKYKTHKQACEVAIKYCLEHLI